MNRADFQTLADVRLEEARVLLAHQPPLADGAYYLAGYALECALKACIARGYAQHARPEKAFVAECHTHVLMTLVKLAGLEPQRAVDANANPALSRNWLVVKDWSEAARYERYTLVKAQEMIDAVGHNLNGVLPWIKARW